MIVSCICLVCFPRVDATLSAFSAASVAHGSESLSRLRAHRECGARSYVCARHFVRVNIIRKHDYAERAATERANPMTNPLSIENPQPVTFSPFCICSVLQGRHYMSTACKIRLMVLGGARCDIVWQQRTGLRGPVTGVMCSSFH